MNLSVYLIISMDTDVLRLADMTSGGPI